jgi:hypothetical protein
MGVIEKSFLALSLLVGGCSKTVSECNNDSDCTSAVYPFCDVSGEYAASGGEHNVCTIVPPNCPVERCGCEPGAVSCSVDGLTTCNSDGKTATTTACALGCDTTNNRCFEFKPSNGLDTAMTAATGQPDVTLATSVTIDTDACDMHDSTNLKVDVMSFPQSQTSAPGICVFVANSFDITNVVANGERAFAFVAPGPITIHGLIDAAAREPFMALLNDGAGAVTLGACVGMSSTEGGGGGNATNGGDGVFPASVPVHRAGGLAQTNFEPLMGGCRGGDDLGGENNGGGGGGGGAVQFDSFTEVQITSSAMVGLGGWGGFSGYGGGAGGTIVIEAPIVTIAGGIATNGGGGGLNDSNCPGHGGAGTNDSIAAPGGVQTCDGMLQHGGAGGAGSSAPQNGTINGGGGGSVGRILIRTGDGTFTGPGGVFSVAKTVGTLQKI